MATSNPTKQWGLLVIEGLLYLLMGSSLFLFANSFTVQSARLVGGLTIAAGLCGAIYTLTNFRADRNNL